MIKAVLFDLDGTLVDLMDLHFETEKMLLNDIFKINLKKSDWISFVGLPEPEFTIQLVAKYGIKREDALIGFSHFEDEKKKFMQGKNIADYITVLPGAVELLSSIKKLNLPIALITGNPPNHGELILNAAKLSEFMDIKNYSVNVKSRDELIHQAVEKINQAGKSKNLPAINFNEVMVVGDSIFDVKSAKNLGCIAVGVCTGFATRSDLENAGADYIFDNLKNTQEFLKLL